MWTESCLPTTAMKDMCFEISFINKMGSDDNVRYQITGQCMNEILSSLNVSQKSHYLCDGTIHQQTTSCSFQQQEQRVEQEHRTTNQQTASCSNQLHDRQSENAPYSLRPNGSFAQEHVTPVSDMNSVPAYVAPNNFGLSSQDCNIANYINQSQHGTSDNNNDMNSNNAMAEM